MTNIYEAAHELGAKGAEPTEAERLLFEAWMRGHCWHLSATWDGSSYRGTAEHGNYVCPRAMNTRQLWAAWRDRAALGAAPASQPDARKVIEQMVEELRSATPNLCNRKSYLNAIAAGLQWLEDAPAAQGCDYCNHPMFVGRKCKNCGNSTEKGE